MGLTKEEVKEILVETNYFTAKWIPYIERGNGPFGGVSDSGYKCSNCGCKNWRETNFCPDCGYNMVEGTLE